MKISLIVAAYNVEKYICRCLDSLLLQSIDDYEIIVVNDCSKDNTELILNEYAKNNKNINIINKEKNEGLSEARNTGLRAACGEYVAFVDGDDYVEVDTYKKCYELAKRNDADEVVFESIYDRVNGEKIIRKIASTKDIYFTDDDLEICFNEMIGTAPENLSDYQIGFAPWGRIYKRTVIINNALFFISEREYIYEDMTYMFKIKKYMKKICILHVPLYHYCENMNSLTKKINSNRYYEIKKMHNYIMTTAEYKEKEKDIDFILRYNRTILSYIRLSAIQLASCGKREDLFKIIDDDMCDNIMKTYPTQKLPNKQRIFASLLKRKRKIALYILLNCYSLKEKIKSHNRM